MVAERGADIEQALEALGEVLEAQDTPVAIVVVGGAAMILDGHVTRTTRDVDVIAIGEPAGPPDDRAIGPPDELPQAFWEAVARVARDLDLSADWLNTIVGRQWETGLPPGFQERIRWRRLGGLWLGTASRYDLIILKLYAAADSEGPQSVHFQDLLALDPTEAELQKAKQWVLTQDTSKGFAKILDQVIEHASKNR